MLNLPKRIIQVLRYFEEAFSERVWEWAKVLLIGAILAPGERTVTAMLRVMGLHQEQQFQNYHRVLNRATWSSRALSRLLLRLLIQLFVPEDAPIVVGLDETIERRRGAKIAAKGIYRDPVRSSKEFFVKTSGLRWMSMMLLTPIPWAWRVWALPFFTVLAPSERYNQQHRRRHKTLPDWGRQMIRQLRRWLPGRMLVVVADSTYAVLELLACAARMIEPVVIVTRLRLDAALYDPAPVRKPGTTGRPRKKGARQSTLAQRLADPETVWQRITVAWYGGTTRTVELASATAVWYHNGLPPVAIRWVLIRDPASGSSIPKRFCAPISRLRLKPSWSGLFCDGNWKSLFMRSVLIWAWRRSGNGPILPSCAPPLPCSRSFLWSPSLLISCSRVSLCLFAAAAWYTKALPTFSDTLALVRQHLWPVTLSYLSPAKADMIEIPRALFERFIQTLAFAA